jgi:hypothetical protein
MKKSTLLLGLALLLSAFTYAQVERNMVAVEIGTGTWCTYCPGAALGADDLVANGKRVAIIENHNGDSYAYAGSDARNSYYAISGFPTARFDGLNPVVGGDHTNSMYSSYLPKYNSAIAVLSPLTIDYTVTRTGQQFVFDFTVTKVSTLPNNQLVFQFAITQSNIAQVWQGQTEVNFVSRAMIPDYNGTTLDFTNSDVQTVNIVANVDPLWTMADIEFVAFVQDNATKAIQNTIRPVMSDFAATTATNICQNNMISFSNTSVGNPADVSWVFPGGNPASSSASDAVSILYQTPGTYDVIMVTKTGLDTDSVVKNDYVTIRPGAIATVPTGNTLVCTNNLNQTTDYTTVSASAVNYEWQLWPTEAGTITNNGASCTIHWTHNWYGISSLRVRASNDCGLGPWTEYMDITCTTCTGMEPNEADMLKVYPNPASSELNISLSAVETGNVNVMLMNALGKVVYKTSLNTSGKLNHTINVSSLNEGVYFLSLEGKTTNITRKVTIQH